MHLMSPLRRSSELLNKKIMRWKVEMRIHGSSLLTIRGRRSGCCMKRQSVCKSWYGCDWIFNAIYLLTTRGIRLVLWQAHCRILSECSSNAANHVKRNFTAKALRPGNYHFVCASGKINHKLKSGGMQKNFAPWDASAQFGYFLSIT